MNKTCLISLYDAIQNGQTVCKETKVMLPINEEADIYGFIAAEDDMLSNAIDMPPLGEAIVLSNRVVFVYKDKTYSFPIFNSVRKTTEERINIDSNLFYIPKYLALPDGWDAKAYKTYLRDCHPRSLGGRKAMTEIKTEDGLTYYYPNEDDLYFESRSRLRAFGTGIVVITRRITKQSCDIKYEIFDPYEVKIEQKQ